MMMTQPLRHVRGVSIIQVPIHMHQDFSISPYLAFLFRLDLHVQGATAVLSVWGPDLGREILIGS